MSAYFWLNMQMRWEPFKAKSTGENELESIRDYHQVQKVA